MSRGKDRRNPLGQVVWGRMWDKLWVIERVPLGSFELSEWKCRRENRKPSRKASESQEGVNRLTFSDTRFSLGGMLTIMKLSEVHGEPRVKLDRPQLRLGDPIALRVSLERETQGRTEVLNVNSRFRVAAVGYDDNGTQLISLDCIDKAPSWQAVKRRPLATSRTRELGPSRFPPMSLDDISDPEDTSW